VYRTTNKKDLFICKKCKGLVASFKVEYGNENYPDNFDIKHILIMIELSEHEEPRTVKQISQATKIPLKTVYKRTYGLREATMIIERSMLYSLSPKAKRAILNLNDWGIWGTLKRTRKDPNLKIRYHKLQGRFYTRWPIRNFERYIRNGPDDSYAGVFMTFPVGKSKHKRGMNIVTTYAKVTIISPTTICVTFSDILVPVEYSEDWAKGYCILGERIDSLGETLERMFNGLKIDSFKAFSIDSQHIAIVDSVYANRYFRKQGCGMQTDRFMIDNSHNKKELETIHPQKAGEDFEYILELERKAREKNGSLKYTREDFQREDIEDSKEFRRRDEEDMKNGKFFNRDKSDEDATQCDTFELKKK
jgi:hypothetical protein